MIVIFSVVSTWFLLLGFFGFSSGSISILAYKQLQQVVLLCTCLSNQCLFSTILESGDNQVPISCKFNLSKPSSSFNLLIVHYKATPTSVLVSTPTMGDILLVFSSSSILCYCKFGLLYYCSSCSLLLFFKFLAFRFLSNQEHITVCLLCTGIVAYII